jgi:hypothetical protein
MTEAATAAAAALSVPDAPTEAPLTREAAEIRKTELLGNADFQERYLGGETRAHKEMLAVNEALTQSPADFAQVQRELEIGHLRSRAGLTAEHVAEYAERRPVSLEEKQYAQDLKARLFRDKAWVAKYLDGDQEAAKQVALIGVVLCAPIREAGQK